MDKKNPRFKSDSIQSDASGCGAPAQNSPWPDPKQFLARERPARSNVSATASGRAAAARDEGQTPVQRRGEELRVYGRNACLAVFARRPLDVRKVYLSDARIPEFKQVLAWCVKHRLGYRVVENDDLDRLTEAQHHEGVCFEVRRQAPVSLSTLLQGISSPAQPVLLVWLDGVGNPHNVGAMLRSAANFAVRGLILAAGAPTLPAAAIRVAEGGAEVVPVARVQVGENVASLLRGAGFQIAATVPRDGAQLYESALPPRLVLIFGAEGEGMSNDLLRNADLRLTIPGSGAVESLNVAASAAVLFAEYWRQHHGREKSC